MPEAGAELAGGVQTADRNAAGVDDLLSRIVDRSTLRIGDRGPDLTEDEGRLEAHHGARRAPEVRIMATIALSVLWQADLLSIRIIMEVSWSLRSATGLAWTQSTVW